MQNSDDPKPVAIENRRPSWIGLVILGLVVSCVSWGVLQWKYPFFKVGDEFSIGMGAPNEARQALLAEQARVNGWNAAVVLAIAGGLLAGGLAVAARPCCPAVVRAMVGLVIGAAWGGGVGLVGASLFAALMPSDTLPGPAHVGLAQAMVMGVLGCGVGGVYGMFFKQPTAFAAGGLGGALGGAVGGVLYPIVAGLIFPSQGTTEFIAAGASVRGLWLALPLVAIALAAPWACAKQKSSTQ